MKGNSNIMPFGLERSAMDVLNPQKKVIIDMIMVQLLSLIILFSFVLAFAHNKLSQNDLSFVMAGLFASMLMLTNVYSRIAR